MVIAKFANLRGGLSAIDGCIEYTPTSPVSTQGAAFRQVCSACIVVYPAWSAVNLESPLRFPSGNLSLTVRRQWSIGYGSPLEQFGHVLYYVMLFSAFFVAISRFVFCHFNQRLLACFRVREVHLLSFIASSFPPKSPSFSFHLGCNATRFDFGRFAVVLISNVLLLPSANARGGVLDSSDDLRSRWKNASMEGFRQGPVITNRDADGSATFS